MTSAVSTFDEGVILLGHGTRDPEGVAEFCRLVELVTEEMPETPVEGAFLEFAAPPLETAVERLIDRGCARAVVGPVLLFAAGHAKRDIPALCEKASRERSFSIRIADVLESRPELIELSRERFSAAVTTIPEYDPARTLLLMVGRGSHDPEANAEMARFARLRWERENTGWLEVCYLSMTRPTLDEALDFAAATNYAAIVVQPHLLFAGQLIDSIQSKVKRCAEQTPGKVWRVTERLGPSLLLARALVEMVKGTRSPLDA